MSASDQIKHPISGAPCTFVVVGFYTECLRGGTFDCQLPSPEGSEYEHSLIK
jgi:hypothetical protein